MIWCANMMQLYQSKINEDIKNIFLVGEVVTVFLLVELLARFGSVVILTRSNLLSFNYP